MGRSLASDTPTRDQVCPAIVLCVARRTPGGSPLGVCQLARCLYAKRIAIENNPVANSHTSAITMMDADYILRYLTQKPRYTRAQQAIQPKAVYADPHYPDRAAIVLLPYEIPFRCERVTWDASQLSHRAGLLRPDQVNIFAVMTSLDRHYMPLFSILFVGNQVCAIARKWLYFLWEPPGRENMMAVNLLQRYYQHNPHPFIPTKSYESWVLNVQQGTIFADHHNLRKILRGLTI
jgi:hypothetical protein